MIDLQQIKDQISAANDSINNYIGVLESLALQEGKAKDKLSSVTDPDLVDQVFDEVNSKLKEIESERAKVNLRIKSYKSAKANAEQELKQAVEANRVEKYSGYGEDFKKLATEFNKIANKLYDKANEINEKLAISHKEVAVAGNPKTRFSRNDKAMLLSQIPMMVYDHRRQEIMKVTHGYFFETMKKKYDQQGVTYTI